MIICALRLVLLLPKLKNENVCFRTCSLGTFRKCSSICPCAAFAGSACTSLYLKQKQNAMSVLPKFREHTHARNTGIHFFAKSVFSPLAEDRILGVMQVFLLSTAHANTGRQMVYAHFHTNETPPEDRQFSEFCKIEQVVRYQHTHTHTKKKTYLPFIRNFGFSKSQQ